MVPDVMARGGFDAVVGNPPFLGGTKVSRAIGTNMRDWLAYVVTEGAGGGRADLVAYFFLRAQELLNPKGTLGLIATNTVAQGDTREVGLDRMVADGFVITRAIQSRSWPVASANLEYAAVWGSRSPVREHAELVSDDLVVPRISTLLEPAGRVAGSPGRLHANDGITFEGCKPYGDGFVVSAEEAVTWSGADARNAEVLAPYLNGEDLNSRPDASASRWIIDFNDRSEDEARAYEQPFMRVEARVRADRATKSAAVSRAPWWLFFRSRPAMRKAIVGLNEMLVITRHSKTVMPLRVSTAQVASEATVVFATDSFADQAVVSSSLHQAWAIAYGSTLETRVRYTPSDVFETFPRPKENESLVMMGRTLDEQRREIMLRRQLGLTKLYNLVNDPDVTDTADKDVARLREIHVELDHAVTAAYGWEDVPLGHGFHTYRQMERFTISPAARVELLDRLLEENHRRAAAQAPKPKRTRGGRPPWLDEEDD